MNPLRVITQLEIVYSLLPSLLFIKNIGDYVDKIVRNYEEVNRMLTGKQKSYLKGLAHTMQPIIQVGKNGVNDPLIKTVYDALEARELIKVSILQNCFEEPKAIAAEIASVIDAEIIQVIGKTIVFYKESSKKKQIVLPK